MDLNLFKPRRLKIRKKLLKQEEKRKRIESEKRILAFPEIVKQIDELYESQVKFTTFSAGLIFSLHGNEMNKTEIYSIPFIKVKNKNKFLSYMIWHISEIHIKHVPFICLVGTEKFSLRKDKESITNKLFENITISHSYIPGV